MTSQYKTIKASKEQAQTKYAERQASIKKLLKEIEAGLKKSDQECSGAVDWSHVGSLGYIESQLREISDMVNHTGEHAQ